MHRNDLPSSAIGLDNLTFLAVEYEPRMASAIP